MREMDVINRFVKQWAGNNEDTAATLGQLARWYLGIVGHLFEEPVNVTVKSDAGGPDGPDDRHHWRWVTEQPHRVGTYADFRESDRQYFIHDVDQEFLESPIGIAVPALLLGPLDPELDGKMPAPNCPGVWVCWWEGNWKGTLIYKRDNSPSLPIDTPTRCYRLVGSGNWMDEESPIYPKAYS